MMAGRSVALLSTKRATTERRASVSSIDVKRPRPPVALIHWLRSVLISPLIYAGIFAGGSCLAQSKQGANPPPPEKVEAPKVTQGPADGATAPVDPRTYIIGPEDIINVEVWREPDFTKPHGVRPDGKITIPLIGDVQSAGLTPERLATQLAQALKEYINDPQVTVSVQQVNSKKFFITGGVNKTGSYPLVLPTRVFDALSQAGGFREFANKRDIVIVRGDRRIKFNWDEVVKGKKLEQNIFLENGDTIIVKE
jgi:polysaccharide export outer membrane protein